MSPDEGVWGCGTSHKGNPTYEAAGPGGMREESGLSWSTETTCDNNW
jgi:hypothetical protein